MRPSSLLQDMDAALRSPSTSQKSSTPCPRCTRGGIERTIMLSIRCTRIRKQHSLRELRRGMFIVIVTDERKWCNSMEKNERLKWIRNWGSKDKSLFPIVFKGCEGWATPQESCAPCRGRWDLCAKTITVRGVIIIQCCIYGFCKHTYFLWGDFSMAERWYDFSNRDCKSRNVKNTKWRGGSVNACQWRSMVLWGTNMFCQYCTGMLNIFLTFAYRMKIELIILCCQD